jgi:hypothetical protein
MSMRTAAAIATTNIIRVAQPVLRSGLALAIGQLGLIVTVAWISLLGYGLGRVIFTAF